jgi:cell division septum initiation protein DivIVA
MPDQSSAATEHAIIQEITGPLASLPDDALATVNADFPTALRGYDRAAVDEYVEHTSQLVAELQATRSPEAAVRRALERVGEQITGILQRAHETAEQITAQSRREAEDRLEQARSEAAQIADSAERRVKDLDGDTDRIWLERQRIVADARDLAGQLIGLAETAAQRFPAAAAADDGADVTTPYDDDASTRAAATALDADDDDFFDDPEPEPGLEPEPEPEGEGEGERDPEDERDIDATVAFTALEPTPAPARSEPADPYPATEPHAVTDPHVDAADSESTAVIPPASQAANRRSSK